MKFLYYGGLGRNRTYAFRAMDLQSSTFPLCHEAYLRCYLLPDVHSGKEQTRPFRGDVLSFLRSPCLLPLGGKLLTP